VKRLQKLYQTWAANVKPTGWGRGKDDSEDDAPEPKPGKKAARKGAKAAQ
jgi:hypothetical protein